MAKKKQVELTIEEKLQNALVPKEEQPYKIPNNWCWTYFKDIFYIENGYAFKKIDYKKQGIPLVRISNIENGVINIDECIYVDKLEKNEERYIIEKGDLLIALSGATTGKNGVYNLDRISYLNQRIGNIKIKNKTKVVSKYRNYYIALKNEDILNLAYGGAQPNISPKVISYITIPLPPIKEQQRIVNRIESLFTKLDKAKELIENTLAQFEQNKMAILHKAFTGELTAKWRKENNIDLSSWENGILMDFCKINPKKIDTKELDDDMTVSFIPMPCVSDIWGKITKKELRKLGEVKKGYTNFCEGDVLFAKITPCMENGKSAIVDKLENDIGFGSTEFYVFRCNENKLNNKYLHYFVRQKTFRDEAKGEMTGAVGQQRVPKTFLENYKIKLPTIEEQQEIVNILDKLLVKYSKIKDLEKQLEQIELLKKAILAKAFRGELGTNNPDEESAEVLLKEILAEK